MQDRRDPGPGDVADRLCAGRERAKGVPLQRASRLQQGWIIS
jgi:hypothetical protein